MLAVLAITGDEAANGSSGDHSMEFGRTLAPLPSFHPVFQMGAGDRVEGAAHWEPERGWDTARRRGRSLGKPQDENAMRRDKAPSTPEHKLAVAGAQGLSHMANARVTTPESRRYDTENVPQTLTPYTFGVHPPPRNRRCTWAASASSRVPNKHLPAGLDVSQHGFHCFWCPLHLHARNCESLTSAAVCASIRTLASTQKPNSRLT
ncbi:hypothetical protein B0J14DRAFT_557002 [Halenospora varia]|nr:hypothetical protein B0J14DRAFT_557002 [Halenospora varia]